MHLKMQSAIAIVNIPPRTTRFECVPEFNHTINPSVVIIPEAKPKLNPVFIEFFTMIILNVSQITEEFLHSLLRRFPYLLFCGKLYLPISFSNLFGPVYFLSR